MSHDIRVKMDNIYKHFDGVIALKNVNFEVKKGEIHALVGENGAGKSTLMKILSGAIHKDSGQIYLEGKEKNILTPRHAKDLGISIIYQEFVLAADLTVAENIFIDKLTQNRVFINWKKLNKQAAEVLELLGFGEIDPRLKIRELSVAYQQVVEICKALSRNSKILILDEPTAVLTFNEIKKLFSILNKLREQGVSIIYISHRMEEVFNICDTVTVLKDGEMVENCSIKDIKKEELINLMIGRELKNLFPQRKQKIFEQVLKVESLNYGNEVQNVSFSVRKGEILGFSGLVGSGRTETMRAVFGATKKDSGKIIFKSKEVNYNSPKKAVKDGLGMLPEDRKLHGVLIDLSIRINTTLACIKSVRNQVGWLLKSRETNLVNELMKKLHVKYNNIKDSVSSLSGGNQQKISLAKWIAARCECIILDEPTRGVDVGAKVEIYNLINDLAESGLAVIIVSSEMPEIIGMCDRAIVMRHGKIVGELSQNELSEKNLIKLSMGV